MDNTYKNRKSEDTELEKSTAHIIVEIIEYVSNSVVTKNDCQKINRKYKRHVFW